MKFVAKCMVNLGGKLYKAGETFEADKSLMDDLRGAADVVEETASAASEAARSDVGQKVEEKSVDATATRRTRKRAGTK